MSISEVSSPPSLYEEELNEETSLDLSSKNLITLDNIENKYLRALYLQDNQLTSLPDDFFPSLPLLTWLDLRDNSLQELPASIQNHPSLTHLLLQNNCLTSLPNELGTLISNLKVLQVNGNPLTYPPQHILKGGTSKIMHYLHDKYMENVMTCYSDTETTTTEHFQKTPKEEGKSFNSVLDRNEQNQLSVKVSEIKEPQEVEYYRKSKGKCPKLPKSRFKTLPPFCQSSKYLKPVYADSHAVQEEKIKRSFLKDIALKKHRDMLVRREKILQDRKNMELLRKWQKNYKTSQLFNTNVRFKLEAKDFPYDTSPEYMTLLTREDIEKDLPDKFKKNLMRRSRPTVARKNNTDAHLAMKIKQMFQNLESIDLKREKLSPRTEQKVLLNEIQKITEIKEKLKELSINNASSV